MLELENLVSQDKINYCRHVVSAKSAGGVLQSMSISALVEHSGAVYAESPPKPLKDVRRYTAVRPPTHGYT